jgi:hypothetical protein
MLSAIVKIDERDDWAYNRTKYHYSAHECWSDGWTAKLSNEVVLQSVAGIRSNQCEKADHRHVLVVHRLINHRDNHHRPRRID